MDNNLKINYKDIMTYCRTCLNTILPDKNLHNLFDQSEPENLAEVIFSCTSIRMVKNDELLPKKICNDCYSCVIKFYEFKQKAQSIDEKLQLFVSKMCNMDVVESKLCDQILDIKSEDPDFYDDDTETLSQQITVEVPKYKYEAFNDNLELEIIQDSQILEQYKCDVCETVFYNETKLKNHAKKHNNRKSCCSCNKIFKNKEKHQQHLLSHKNKVKCKSETDTKTYKCDMCGNSYDKKHSLSAHMKKHRDNRSLSCSICSKTFKKSYSLNRHKSIHMHNLSNINESQTHSSVKEELNSNNIDTPNNCVETSNLFIFECKICHAAFRKSNSLSAHMKIHKDSTKSLTCSICSKTFKKSYHLNRHELIHVKNFRCTFCPKTFLERSEWREHVKRHDEYAPIPCPVCSKLLSHQESLARHMKVHTRERGCLCPHCGKTFENFSNLRQHIKRHLGQKDFSCILCPEKFISRGELKHHMVVHTEERAFSCNQCGLKFTRKGSLKMHKLKHLDVRPFKCDSCPMGFPTKYMLQRHTRIHTGEKPFKCDLCDRTFGQSGELLKHRRTHLGEKIHRCHDCNESFRYKVQLRKHISEHYTTEKTKNMIEEDNIQSSLITDAQ